MLRCHGVAEQRTAYLGSSASLPEALGDLGGLVSFWSDLGWLEHIDDTFDAYITCKICHRIELTAITKFVNLKLKPRPNRMDSFHEPVFQIVYRIAVQAIKPVLQFQLKALGVLDLSTSRLERRLYQSDPF
ncbi:jg5681 [Pararge aegeria aegeria]|uniref:Jg5681 protein n=1 Tax=Pararge aegeria aegeria TaxID=348720 RepID=A0A8S4RMR2_9NEOP|nr:jg5681 [Pararge aegeria aegeria]